MEVGALELARDILDLDLEEVGGGAAHALAVEGHTVAELPSQLLVPGVRGRGDRGRGDGRR